MSTLLILILILFAAIGICSLTFYFDVNEDVKYLSVMLTAMYFLIAFALYGSIGTESTKSIPITIDAVASSPTQKVLLYGNVITIINAVKEYNEFDSANSIFYLDVEYNMYGLRNSDQKIRVEPKSKSK